MLKSLGKATLVFRLGTRVYVCMRRRRMDDGLVTRIRPRIVGPYAIWSDRPGAG